MRVCACVRVCVGGGGGGCLCYALLLLRVDPSVELIERVGARAERERVPARRQRKLRGARQKRLRRVRSIWQMWAGPACPRPHAARATHLWAIGFQIDSRVSSATIAANK
jgi:hypothetical protein